jgi:hypothetical protein
MMYSVRTGQGVFVRSETWTGDLATLREAALHLSCEDHYLMFEFFCMCTERGFRKHETSMNSDTKPCLNDYTWYKQS